MGLQKTDIFLQGVVLHKLRDNAQAALGVVCADAQRLVYNLLRHLGPQGDSLPAETWVVNKGLIIPPAKKRKLPETVL